MKSNKWFSRIGIVALLILALILGINSTVSAQTNLMTNPGLETGVGQTPTGWSESGGNLTASKSESGNPHSGTYKGTHWLSSAYNVNTYQTKTGLTNGTYTLRAWVMSGGGQSTAVMKAENCGGSTQTMNIPTTSTWTQITMSVSVTNGQCTVGFSSVASANQWLNFDDVEFFLSGSSPTSTPTSSGCTPTTITPYVQINGGTWQQTASASVNVGDSVKFGPQPTDANGWSWSGPNSFSATTREVTISNIQTNQAGNYIASYTNSSSCTSNQTFTVSVAGSGPTPTRTPTPNGPTATPTRTSTPSSGLTIRGADVSTLQRALDQGQVYYNASGVAQNPLDILQSIGVNYIRLRVWNNPGSGYNNKDKVVAFAPQIKSRGMKLLIDLHYSDTWADPGKQYKPAAWNGHNISQLQTDVYNYTLDVCNSLKAVGATPDMIQIGNEITPGMLWEEGRISNNNFVNVSLLLKQGYNAVKACNASTQVMLHIDRGGDNAGARWWYDGVQAQGVNWDVTGLSFYCYWHGTTATMQSNVADMKARYGKSVVIVETAYPFSTGNGDSQGNVITSSTPCSGYSASLTGQANNFNAVKTAIQNGGGIGVFYWEPTWVGTPGNGWDPANINGTGSEWDNQAIFDFSFHLNPNISW